MRPMPSGSRTLNSHEFEAMRNSWTRIDTGLNESRHRKGSPTFQGLQVERETTDTKEEKPLYLQQPMKLRLDSEVNEFNANNATMGQISS